MEESWSGNTKYPGLSVMVFQNRFNNSPLGVGNPWLFAEEKNVANQVQTCIFQIPLDEALKWYMSAKIPGAGEGVTVWPMDYKVDIGFCVQPIYCKIVVYVQ